MRITLAYAAALYLALLIWGADALPWALVVLFPMWGVTLALFTAEDDPEPTYSPMDKTDGRK